MVERFAEADFWMWTGIVFGVNAIAMALLGVTVPAVLAAATGFSALLTAAVIGRNAVWERRRDGRSPV